MTKEEVQEAILYKRLEAEDRHCYCGGQGFYTEERITYDNQVKQNIIRCYCTI